MVKRKKPVRKRRAAKPLDQLSVVRNKVLEFLSLRETSRIAIISDNDEDGVCAAVQMKKFLDLKRVESEVFFYDHQSKTLGGQNSYFVNFNPEKTIFLDINEELISTIMETYGKATGPFLVIDHHQGDVVRNNSFKCLVIKPRSFSDIEPSKYPTSKLVADLFLGIDWICAIGVIGDYSFDQWSDYLQKVQKKYSFTKSKLHSLSQTIGCITSQYPEKINSLFSFLYSARRPSEVFESDFYSLKKLFDKRLALLKDLFYKGAERYDSVGLLMFKSDPRFSSKLSTLVSAENRDKVVIIYEDIGHMIKCSIRRQDFRINCSALAKAAVAGIPQANGGGHIPAAGAAFPREYLEHFKRNVKLYLIENPPRERLD